MRAIIAPILEDLMHVIYLGGYHVSPTLNPVHSFRKSEEHDSQEDN
jgi:hypothetical protein